jgi:drug/metabolite transporter (DMT)-like permease
MLAIGLIAAVGHYLLIRAYERAPASLLAPFGYFEIIMAVIVGFVLFGDFPDLWTWVGIAVLVASGLYISLRERKLMIQGADL